MDECQLAVNPKLLEIKNFDSEEDFKKFKESWNGEQLGAETELKNGKIGVAMPNPVSKAISKAIKMAEKEVGLKVELGYEWVVHKNWYGCH